MMQTHAISGSDEAPAENQRMLADARVLAITLCGGAGAGKTALLEQTLRRLRGRYRPAVIVANPKADRDAHQLQKHVELVVPIPTATLSAVRLHDALVHMPLDGIDVLFIETVAGLTNSTCDQLGQDARVAVFSVSGGDDKAAEFPHGVSGADLVLLNKLDLLPLVHFDPRVFESDVRRLNLDVPVLHVSAAQGTGLGRWEQWLGDQLRWIAPSGAAARWLEPPEVFLG